MNTPDPILRAPLASSNDHSIQRLKQRFDEDEIFRDGLFTPLHDQLVTLLHANGAKVSTASVLSLVNWQAVVKTADFTYAEDANAFHVMNTFGDLVRTTASDLIGKGHQGQIQRLFGEPVYSSEIAKIMGGVDVELQSKLTRESRSLVMNILLQYAKTYRQASTRRIAVDLFSKQASLAVEGGEALYSRPLELVAIKEQQHAQAVMADFTEHFPELADFIELLCAARFAPDRRQAFLWLQCTPGWGKSMLLSALAQLGLVVEISGKEAEACFEGKPVGLDPNKLARAWVLAFDEARYVKTETKQLAKSLHLTPKYGQRTEVPVYLKLFISAEDIDSLAGTEGVETQFADRFSYMSGSGRVEDRPLFKQLGGGAYVRCLAAGIALRVTRYVEVKRHDGRDQAEKDAETQLKSLHAQYRITHSQTDLRDTLKDYAEELKTLLREFAAWKHIGPMPHSVAVLPTDLQRRLESSCIMGFIGPRDERIGVICLKRPKAFVGDWLGTLVDRSERVKVTYKVREICNMVSELPADKATRLYSTANDTIGEYVKAVTVNRKGSLLRGNVVPIRPDAATTPVSFL